MAYKTKKETPPPAQPLPADPIYTLQAAAGILGLEERAVARKLIKGEITGKKKNGRWYTTHTNLLAYVNS